MGKLIETTGVCRFCKQTRIVKAFEDDDQERIDKEATRMCECAEAKEEAKREMKIDAAYEYIKNMLDKNDHGRILLQTAVDAIVNRSVTKVSAKIGKHTYTIEMNGDGDIKIKRKFEENQEETF